MKYFGFPRKERVSDAEYAHYKALSDAQASVEKSASEAKITDDTHLFIQEELGEVINGSTENLNVAQAEILLEAIQHLRNLD